MSARGQFFNVLIYKGIDIFVNRILMRVRGVGALVEFGVNPELRGEVCKWDGIAEE